MVTVCHVITIMAVMVVWESVPAAAAGYALNQTCSPPTSLGGKGYCGPDFCDSAASKLPGCVFKSTQVWDYPSLISRIQTKTCKQSTDARCTSAALKALMVGQGIKAAYCNDAFLVIQTDASSGFPNYLGSIKNPPASTSSDGTSCVTRYVNQDFMTLKIPLYPEMLSTSDPLVNNVNPKAFPNGGANADAAYMSTSVKGTGATMGLPTRGAVGVTVGGQIIFPAFNNMGYLAPQKCEVDTCNQHVGGGGGQPHLHGDPFGSWCLYSAKNYSCPETHPPQIGWALDGYSIYGRHLSASNLGYSRKLDSCGGHIHGNYTYHYHAQVFSSVTNDGVAHGMTQGVTYYASTTGPYKCLKGDISKIPNYWGKLATSHVSVSPDTTTAVCVGSKNYYTAKGITLPTTSSSSSTTPGGNNPKPPPTGPKTYPSMRPTSSVFPSNAPTRKNKIATQYPTKRNMLPTKLPTALSSVPPTKRNVVPTRPPTKKNMIPTQNPTRHHMLPAAAKELMTAAEAYDADGSNLHSGVAHALADEEPATDAENDDTADDDYTYGDDSDDDWDAGKAYQDEVDEKVKDGQNPIDPPIEPISTVTADGKAYQDDLDKKMKDGEEPVRPPSEPISALSDDVEQQSEEAGHRVLPDSVNRLPTSPPTRAPVVAKSVKPTRPPTLAPTMRASNTPSPSRVKPGPSNLPTLIPSLAPSARPSRSARPSKRNQLPSRAPTRLQSNTPVPTKQRFKPSPVPSKRPTKVPTEEPTEPPTRRNMFRTEPPTEHPTRRYMLPTETPTEHPTRRYMLPTVHPTRRYMLPTHHPTRRNMLPTAARALAVADALDPNTESARMMLTDDSIPSPAPVRRLKRTPTQLPSFRPPTTPPTRRASNSPNPTVLKIIYTNPPSRRREYATPEPSDKPTTKPTLFPSPVPTRPPTRVPTIKVTFAPSPRTPSPTAVLKSSPSSPSAKRPSVPTRPIPPTRPSPPTKSQKPTFLPTAKETRKPSFRPFNKPPSRTPIIATYKRPSYQPTNSPFSDDETPYPSRRKRSSIPTETPSKKKRSKTPTESPSRRKRSSTPTRRQRSAAPTTRRQSLNPIE